MGLVFEGRRRRCRVVAFVHGKLLATQARNPLRARRRRNRDSCE